MMNKNKINLITSGGFSQRRIFIKGSNSLGIIYHPAKRTITKKYPRRSPFIGIFYKKRF